MRFWGLLILQLAAFFGAVGALMAVNYKLDPFHYYSKPDPKTDLFVQNARYQNPALIKHLDYNTLILGTSRSQNFTYDMITRPDWTPLSVTAEGSSISYHKLAAEMAIRENKPDVIILEISKLSYLRGLGRNNNHTVPDYLYKPNLETSFNHLLTFDFIRRSRQLVQTDIHALDGLQSWMPDHFTKFEHGAFMGDLAVEACELEPLGEMSLSSKVGAGWKEAVYDGLVTLIADNPSIEFRLWFPSRHVIEYYSRQSEVKAILQFRAHILSAISRFENVKVYDFASDLNLVHDYGDYKDTGHFDLKLQSLIFEEIQNDNSAYRLNKAEWDINNDPITKAIYAYDPSIHKDCGGDLGVLSKREIDKRAIEAERYYVSVRKEQDKVKLAYDEFYATGIILGRRRFFLRLAEAKFYGWGTEKDYKQTADIVFERRMAGNAKAQLLRGKLQALEDEKWYDPDKARQAFLLAEAMGFKSARRDIEKLDKKISH